MLGAAALSGYAWHAWRATGVRWVLSAFVIGPMTLYVFAALPAGREPGLLVPAVLVTLAVAVVLTRYADRLLPWDALALAVVAVTFPLMPEVLRAGAETVTHVLLVLLCFGLVWAVGFIRVAMRPGTVTRPVAGLLALGTAALLLGAQLLLPLLLTARWDSSSRPWWVSALTGGAALAVALLFLADRAADRRRGSDDAAVPAGPPDRPVDPETTPESPVGPVTIEIER